MSETKGGDAESHSRPLEEVENVVIRFAGDSGDGMQLTGSRFSADTALHGYDLRTLPDYPAEIRAPAGTLAGVSAFQISFSTRNVYTPGDAVDVLVVMNPAALKSNLNTLDPGGMIIANQSQFTKKNIERVGYATNPLEDESLAGYRLYRVDISKLTETALEELGLPTRSVDRCKNFFALGLTFWLYNRALDTTLEWIEKKFGNKPELAEANRRALKAGYYYGDTTELFDVRYNVKPAEIAPGRYRNITGNSAMAIGLVAAADRSGRELFLGSYPITPASTILHDLARYKSFGVHTFQAEDEIAGVTAAIGAAFGGALEVTVTSGPGLALKAEALGLAVMVELPLVVISVQRGGPSTGLPTKTEQADLLQALYGRNGEAPMPVLAAATPADCFDVAYEASRIALKYGTPVLVLSDGYLANGSEPWKLPEVDELPPIGVDFLTNPEGFHPYSRDPATLSRPSIRAGTPGLEHRIGGLEKQHITGDIDYEPQNHERMIRLRAEKVARVAREIPKTEIQGDATGDLLVVGWGSTQGAIYGAVDRIGREGKLVSAIHLRYVNPLPPDLLDIMRRFERIVVPELNAGQLAFVLRAHAAGEVRSICKVQGQPFSEREIHAGLTAILEGRDEGPYLTDLLRDAADSSSAAAIVEHLDSRGT
ncbi:MAG: 2-oxoacid:acceptor oxidoreductase subunit alpha [Myxococcota bacterium]